MNNNNLSFRFQKAIRSKLIPCIVILILWITFFCFTGVFNNDYCRESLLGTENGTTGELYDGMLLQQSITPDYNNFSGFSVKAGTYGRTNSGILTLRLFDDSDTLISESAYDISTLYDNGFVSVTFDTQPESAGKTYTIEAEISGSQAGNAITLYLADRGENEAALLPNENSSGSMLYTALIYTGETASFLILRAIFWLLMVCLTLYAALTDKIPYKEPILYIALAAVVIRILFSEMLGMFYLCYASCDDQLLMNYADFSLHFLEPNHLSLAKDMGFPVFLNFVRLTGLTFTTCLSLIWAFAAFCVLKIISLLTGNKILRYFFFFYTLFMPCAFDIWSGARLYRNCIIAPFTVIVLCTMLVMIISFVQNRSIIWKISSGIGCGISFTFFYYIKEDGIWILACLLVALLVCLFGFRKCHLKRSIISLFLLSIPLIIFAITTSVYKDINYKYFGVKEINTRTEGALGEFVKKIYAIDSENRDYYCWAPYDAIEKAFNASPTLSEHRELYDSIVEVSGGIDTPIMGDHLSWNIRTALSFTGPWSETGCEEMFAKVNDELDKAFANGTLEKDSKIQLLSSAGGRSLPEILQLKDDIYESYLGAVLLKGYVIRYNEVSTDIIAVNKLTNDFASQITRLNYFKDYSSHRAKADAIAPILLGLKWIFRIINPLLLIIAFAGVARNIYLLLFARKKSCNASFCRNSLPLLGSIFGGICFLGISFVYTFGICWFSEFLFNTEAASRMNQILNFYNASLPVILMFFYIFGFYCFTISLKKNNPDQ